MNVQIYEFETLYLIRTEVWHVSETWNLDIYDNEHSPQSQHLLYRKCILITVCLFDSLRSLLYISSVVFDIQTFLNTFECLNISKPAIKSVSQGLNVTKNSRLVLNIFSNLKEFIGGTIQLHLLIISAFLIQFYCIIFMGRGKDSQRVRLGDGEDRGVSPAQVFTCPESRQAS